MHSPQNIQPSGVDNDFRSPESVLAARSVAVVGASERSAWARMIIRNLHEFGFPGKIFLVNPRQREVFGEPCFPSLRELPETVEHALVIVPAPAVPDVLMDAERAGVRSATIYAGAMGDGVDPQSQKRGAWLKDFLARGTLRVAGPNCMGSHSCSAIPIRICAGCRPAARLPSSSRAARCSSG
jgi:acyl-CoA synthetase (NDP forming)